MKTKCDRCRARGFINGTSACSLGYKTDGKGNPLEPCPKPLTYLALIDARAEVLEETRARKEEAVK